jgi:threonine dehydrogenase-like Zn-dependent dehydrogenase
VKAFVYKGRNEVAVENVPDPKMEGPTDAIIKITTAPGARAYPSAKARLR